MSLRISLKFTPEQRYVCQYIGKKSRSRFGIAYAEGVAVSGKPCLYIVDQTGGYTAWSKAKTIERNDLSPADIGLSNFKFNDRVKGKERYALHINTGCVYTVPKDAPDSKGTLCCYTPQGTMSRLYIHLLEWITKEEYDEWAKLQLEQMQEEEVDKTGWRICRDCNKPIDPFNDGGWLRCNPCITARRKAAEDEQDTEWMTGDEYAPYPQKTKRESGFDRKDNVY